MEARSVLDGLGAEPIHQYPTAKLVPPGQRAVGERLGEDDHVAGAGTGVGHRGLILLPQRDTPRAREVRLVAAGDGAEAAAPGWLVGDQELHR